jgi:TonB family protein
MRMRCFLVLSLLVVCSFGSVSSAQSDQASDTRKVIRKTSPTYPEIAKRMHLSGTVRVTAIVASDGTVKKVEPMGGSPVLIEASKEAVLNWKYAPASSETKEVVELHFASLDN